MIKLIIFIVIILFVITSFSINLGFFTNGFTNITSFFESIPGLFNVVKDTITTLFASPTISIILITGLTFVIIKYGLSMIGDEKK